MPKDAATTYDRREGRDDHEDGGDHCCVADLAALDEGEVQAEGGGEDGGEGGGSLALDGPLRGGRVRRAAARSTGRTFAPAA